jgi:hypothetical protein
MASPDAKAYPHSQPIIVLPILIHDLNGGFNQYPGAENVLP